MKYVASKKTMITVLILTMAFLTYFYIGNSYAQLTAKANHDHITIDFFYNGSTVGVKGISDPGTDLIIKIASQDGHQSLREKGKVGGVLWMNTGELKIEQVPNLYFLQSTRNVEDILSKEETNKYVIGYPALKDHIQMNVAVDGEKTKWFNEFIKFKESSKLYATSSGKISVAQKGGVQDYYILTQWPYQALPGNYTVTVYAVKDKKVIETATANVFVEQVGLVKAFANMAKNNAAVYGIISILAALGSGFGVGLVFKKSGGAH